MRVTVCVCVCVCVCLCVCVWHCVLSYIYLLDMVLYSSPKSTSISVCVYERYGLYDCVFAVYIIWPSLCIFKCLSVCVIYVYVLHVSFPNWKAM
uniref:Uncharacterized protein n=1 Tax=Octopus bimaculoides TaxID=37653 RepID=A0A0L8IEG3_OCTBM